MKFRNFILAILMLAGTAFSNRVFADHFAAGDIWITYIGAGVDGCTGTTEYKYEIIFDQYKACDVINGATLFPGVTINYQSLTAKAQGYPAAGATAYQGGVTLSLVSDDTLDQLCDTFKHLNSCYTPIVGQPIGFERIRSSAIFTLPYAQPDWTFWFWSCCTSNNLTNVPWYQPFYIECMINNVVKYNNSTPRFLVSPLPYICNNQPTTFLNGPFDPNNDSLRTQNIVHYTHNNPNVAPTWLTFTPPYTLQDPVGSASSNPYRMDTLTGAASFTPTLAGRYTFDFQCNEYDRKTQVLTGYIRRTCEVNILNCTYPPPLIDSIPVTIKGGTVQNGKKVIITCPGNNVNFTITGKAVGPTSKIYLDASTNTIPGSTFTVAGAGSQAPVGTFQWTPTTNDYGIHQVILTSKDSTCNSTGTLIVQKNYTVLIIKVVKGLDAGPDRPVCKLFPTPRQLFVNGAEDLTSVLWTDISGGPAKYLSANNIVDPISNPEYTTQYVVSSPDLVDNCKIRDTVSVYIDTTNSVDIFPTQNPFVLCRPDYLQLDAVVKGKGPLNNFTCGPANDPPVTPLDSFTVYGSSVYGLGFSYDTLGSAAAILYNTVRSTKLQFIILKSELKEYGIRAATLNSLKFETTKCTAPSTFEYSNFKISLKCVDGNKTSLNKALGFETGMIPVYTAPGPTYFPDGTHSFNFDVPYNIDSTKNLVVEICYSSNPAVTAGCTPLVGAPPLIKYMPTTYTSTLEYKPINDIPLTVCATTTNPDIVEKNGRPVLSFNYHDAPYLPFFYKWSPGAYLSDSTLKQPLSYVSKTTQYRIETVGNSGCVIRDTMNIYMPTHDFSVWPKDTSICFGESAPLEVRKGTYYQWFEYENGKYLPANKSLSCDYCASPIAKPLKTTHYKIKVGDEVFCYDTIDAYIEVRPLPLVNILNKDTVVKYGQSMQLMVNGARVYNWTPVSSLNNPNISYPVATPSEPTMYVVAGIGTNGCRAFDTVRVGLDYRDNLFIPTAFSPNGDGKNDVFKVSNMTFQRFIEFRVFNRWGQEIYNGGGGDPHKGWDGSWKGVPQEIGNYQYLIRVGYPDGYVETYKGDVTLVR